MTDAEKKELTLAIESGKDTDWGYDGNDEYAVDVFYVDDAIKQVQPWVEKYATERVEAYKEALRSAIEKEIKRLQEKIDIRTAPQSIGYIAQREQTKWFLSLLDSVTPKE